MIQAIQQFDESILFYILEHLHTPFLDQFMIGVTKLGDSGTVWIAIAFALLLFKKTRTCGVLLVVALLIEYLLCDGILKNLIARERPFSAFPEVELLYKKPGSFSFPSGHTMSSFTSATILIYWFKRAGIPAIFLATLIAFSRMYLFFHYPSDVLAGALFGIATGIFVILIAKAIRFTNRLSYQ
jgi:undecaprenyl-diphosphatase